MKLRKLMNGFLQDYLEENGIQCEDWSINVNNQDGFGDYSSNIALKLSSYWNGMSVNTKKVIWTRLKVINPMIIFLRIN